MKLFASVSRLFFLVPFSLVLFPFSFILLSGCNFQPPPDPNDPADGTPMQAEVMLRNLNWASESLSSRVFERQITREDADRRLQKFSEDLAYSIPKTDIDPVDAWRYGEVLRTAKQWARAEAMFEMASKYAKHVNDEDRFVNDSLHYAEALAHNGKFKEAIVVVRSTFAVSAKNKAPILFGTLYQVVPAAKNSGLNIEVAKLLEEAIEQHRKVIVDVNTHEGASFISTRQYHVMKAWQKVIELYREANRPDLADAARAKRDRSGMMGI